MIVQFTMVKVDKNFHIHVLDVPSQQNSTSHINRQFIENPPSQDQLKKKLNTKPKLDLLFLSNKGRNEIHCASLFPKWMFIHKTKAHTYTQCLCISREHAF